MFANLILSPDCISRRSKKNISYYGIHELAYLHPSIFTTDASVLNLLGVKIGEPYFILRFNAFKAHHDIGEKGLSDEQKDRLIELLKKRGKIFVTTELADETKYIEYKIEIPVEKIHDVLFYATLFIGDSQTMTSEAAVLGTPALKCNTFANRLSVPNMLENKYELSYSFRPEEFEKMLEKINTILVMPDVKSEWQKRRQRLLNDKINVTAFLVWFVENYPESVRIMKENSDYQYRFR